MMDRPKGILSSARECRLWCLVGLVVLAIFSTLALAQTLSGFLGDKGFGVIPFIVGMCLVLVTITTNGLSERPAARVIVVASGVLAVYLLVFVRMAIPTERSHLIEYGVLSVFILAALRERNAQGRTVVFPPFLAALFASGIGFLDECLQRIVPSRVFDWEDVLFNVLASVMAVVSSELLAWTKSSVHKIIGRQE